VKQATIGIDFLVRNTTHKSKTYRLQLWDTAGQERFKSLIPNYLKDSHLCIFVYDLGNLQSLESVDKWMEMYNQHREEHALCVIIGNKSDMVERSLFYYAENARTRS
jgi:small GTP-binding protein